MSSHHTQPVSHPPTPPVSLPAPRPRSLAPTPVPRFLRILGPPRVHARPPKHSCEFAKNETKLSALTTPPGPPSRYLCSLAVIYPTPLIAPPTHNSHQPSPPSPPFGCVHNSYPSRTSSDDAELPQPSSRWRTPL